MHILTGDQWGAAIRYFLWCGLSGVVATLVLRLTVRKARPQVESPSFLAGYAVVGAAGFFAVNAWFRAPLEAGVWGGVFFGFIADGLISRFAFRRKAERRGLNCG